MEADWEGLYSRASRATPFQSWAWVRSWLEAYGGAVAPYVLAVIDTQKAQVIAVAPLVRGGAPVRRLHFIGEGISDVLDFLVEDGYEDVAADALTDALSDRDDWDVLDMQEVQDGAAAESMYRAWSLGKVRFEQSVSLELEVRPMEELTRSMGPKAARQLRRQLRKVDQVKMEVRQAQPAAGLAAVDRLLELHRRRWHGRGMNPEHASPRFRRHLQQAVPALLSQNRARLFEYSHEGEVIASRLLLLGKQASAGYLYGIDDSALRMMNISTLFMRTDITASLELGLRLFSMLRGKEQHKYRWNPVERRNRRLILTRSLRGRCYARGHSAMAAGVGYLRSDQPPASVRAVATSANEMRRRFKNR